MAKRERTEVAPPIPPDLGLPGAGGLFSEKGIEALGTFLEARGWSLREARAVQALYRPERSCLVRFRARALDATGRPRVLTLAAECRAPAEDPPSPHPDLAARHGLDEPVGFVPPWLVWAFPYDPALAALPDAAWGPAVKDALGEIVDGPLAVRVRGLRYRPRRRAVFRYGVLAKGPDARRSEVLFGKVLRRSKTRRALEVAECLSANGWARRARKVRLSLPVGSTSWGSLMYAPARGRSLRDLLVGGDSLPAPERVAGLLDDVTRLAEVGDGQLAGVSIRPPLETATHAADLLRRLVPGAAPDVERVMDAIRAGVARDSLPSRLVHGDLYEAQVFVEEDFSLGLIDLDDVALGDPALDAANFCAHLLALALSAPRAAGRLAAYRALVRRAFLARLDVGPEALAWREALAMLLLATGPFRVLEPSWPDEVVRRIRLALRLSRDS